MSAAGEKSMRSLATETPGVRKEQLAVERMAMHGARQDFGRVDDGLCPSGVVEGRERLLKRGRARGAARNHEGLRHDTCVRD